MFIATTATKKIMALSKRIRFVNGGSSSSKTISILLWLINYAQSHENEIISVISESMPHLRIGAMRDFLIIMQTHRYYDDTRWNKSFSTYEFETGSKIEFFSADQSGKVHGPRRDILYINEANNIDYSVYVQLEIRTKKVIFVDSNPTHEYWMYTEVLPHNDVDFITVTYRDNEALEPSIVASLEAKQHNVNFWRVYGLGQLGISEGKIYKDWNIIDEIPHEARLERYGLDFGYTNDPTAIVAVYKYNGGFIFDEIAYQKGLSNKQIYDILETQPKAMVIADSAEPKSIDEIKTYGITIMPATKGPGSVNHGIQFIQDQRVSITKRSVNTLKEYRNYMWMQDRDGKITNTPESGWDHALDALRYALSTYKQTETILDLIETEENMLYPEIGV